MPITGHGWEFHVRRLGLHRRGDQVAVAYQPATEKARILTFGQRYGFATILGIVGSALIMWTSVLRIDP